MLRTAKQAEELHWLNQSEFDIEIEMVKRFERFFTRKSGKAMTYCAICKAFTAKHQHVNINGRH